jgi:hypothetical protein
MVVAGPGPVRKSHYDWMEKQPRRGEISGGARSVPALGDHGENLGPIPNAIKKAGACVRRAPALAIVNHLRARAFLFQVAGPRPRMCSTRSRRPQRLTRTLGPFLFHSGFWPIWNALSLISFRRPI